MLKSFKPSMLPSGAWLAGFGRFFIQDPNRIDFDRELRALVDAAEGQTSCRPTLPGAVHDR